MSQLSPPIVNALHNAVLVARNSGHAEVGLLHMLCGILEAEPELAGDLTADQVRKLLPKSSGESRFKPKVLAALEYAHRYTAELAEPEEVHCLEALLEPGQALVLLAHHLGVEPEHWRQQLSRAKTSEPGLELLPDSDEWRMVLIWLENPVSQVRSWLNEEQLNSAIAWVARIVGPLPKYSDTGWLTRAKQCAARDAGRQPLSSRRLFHALLQQREVALLHWRVGGSWIKPVGLHSFWHSPGLAVARHYNHPEVTELHVLLDSLNEPMLQADLNPLRQAVRKVLERAPGQSNVAARALRRTLKYCRRWRVEPGRVHVAYVLLREFATGPIADALEWSGRDARSWLKRLRRFITGRLRPGDWLVDGVGLGSAASELGPLRAIEDAWETMSGTRFWLDEAGKVKSIVGRALLCGEKELLGPTTRHYSAEALVGTGRLERWLPFREVELEVRCEGGYVVHVGLRSSK